MIFGLPSLTVACLIYAVAANIFAFACFGIDKRRAETGNWRIPEAALLRFALLGGLLGAKLGQRMFRHKTRKQPFAVLLNAIGFVYLAIGLLIGLANMPLTFDQQALMAHFFSAGPSADRPALPRRFGPGSDL